MDKQAISKSDKYLIIKMGTRRLQKLTIGWRIKVRWHDGSEDWVPLKILKENYPIQMAEYTMICS